MREFQLASGPTTNNGSPGRRQHSRREAAIPVFFVLSFYTIGLIVRVLVLVFAHELEGRLVRRADHAPWAVAAARVGVIGLALLYLWKAKILRAAGDAALLGLPVSVNFVLLPDSPRSRGQRGAGSGPLHPLLRTYPRAANVGEMLHCLALSEDNS